MLFNVKKQKVVTLLQRNRKPDPRIRRTNRFIREALIRLIDEKGYDAITVLDITGRADINRSTFYYHYRDKEELLRQTVEDMLAMAEKELLLPLRIPSHDPEEERTQLLARLMDHVDANNDYYRIMLSHIPQLGRRLSAMIQQLASPCSGGSASSKLPVKSRDDIWVDAIVRWLNEPPPRSSEAMARRLLRLLKAANG